MKVLAFCISIKLPIIDDTLQEKINYRITISDNILIIKKLQSYSIINSNLPLSSLIQSPFSLNSFQRKFIYIIIQK